MPVFLFYADPNSSTKIQGIYIKSLSSYKTEPDYYFLRRIKLFLRVILMSLLCKKGVIKMGMSSID